MFTKLFDQDCANFPLNNAKLSVNPETKLTDQSGVERTFYAAHNFLLCVALTKASSFMVV